MKLFLKIIPFLLLLLAACSFATQPASGGAPDGANPSAPTQVTTPIKRSNGAFALTIFSPPDQAVVSEPKVDLRGEVSKDAVLTVNDDTYVLKPGSFVETVQLEEGLNAVQIVASDMDGNEIDLILTITYQP